MFNVVNAFVYFQTCKVGLLFQQSQHDNMTTYIMSQERGAILTMATTLSILYPFAFFFHCCTEH